jgi:hypothetical protein
MRSVLIVYEIARADSPVSLLVRFFSFQMVSRREIYNALLARLVSMSHGMARTIAFVLANSLINVITVP